METTRHIRRVTWVFVAFTLLFIASTYFVQRRIETRISEPLPAVAKIYLTSPMSPLDNPILCPGDTLQFSLLLDVTRATVADIDSVVRRSESNALMIPSVTVRTIYDIEENVPLASSWIVPKRLPALFAEPERDWLPGQYRHVIAITNKSGNRDASVVSINFRIAENCKG